MRKLMYLNRYRFFRYRYGTSKSWTSPSYRYHVPVHNLGLLLEPVFRIRIDYIQIRIRIQIQCGSGFW
jgi:hypothetical protein